jgi:hypothetical protein
VGAPALLLRHKQEMEQEVPPPRSVLLCSHVRRTSSMLRERPRMRPRGGGPKAKRRSRWPVGGTEAAAPAGRTRVRARTCGIGYVWLRQQFRGSWSANKHPARIRMARRIPPRVGLSVVVLAASYACCAAGEWRTPFHAEPFYVSAVRGYGGGIRRLAAAPYSARCHGCTQVCCNALMGGGIGHQDGPGCHVVMAPLRRGSGGAGVVQIHQQD